MKTSQILSILIFSTAINLSGQELQNRAISPFDKIETSGSVHVFYTDSDSLSLSVKAKAKELENVETKVENGNLIVSNRGNFTQPVYVYVKNNHLKQIQANGASVFKTINTIKEDSISFVISSSANVEVSINALKIKSVQSGASQLTLSGTTDRFLAELSGASSLKAYDLVSKNTDIFATGASSSKIYVKDKLRANASGASSIKVRGEVTDISAEAESASSILKIVDNDKQKNKDSTEFHLGRRKIIIVDKDREDISIKGKKKDYEKKGFRHWAGFSLGVNGYMNSPGNIDLPIKYDYMDLNYGRSFNIQLNILEKQFNIVKNYFKIVTGLGLDYHMYTFANKTNLDPDSSFTVGDIDSNANFVYRKNKLRNTYIQVPLLFEFNTSNNPRKTFHLAFGVIGQYLIASRTKQIIEQDKFELTRIRKDSYNLSPFAAKAHLNFGYKCWTFYAEYSLTSLFKAGKGPELYPFSLGLRVIPFT